MHRVILRNIPRHLLLRDKGIVQLLSKFIDTKDLFVHTCSTNNWAILHLSEEDKSKLIRTKQINTMIPKPDPSSVLIEYSTAVKEGVIAARLGKILKTSIGKITKARTGEFLVPVEPQYVDRALNLKVLRLREVNLAIKPNPNYTMGLNALPDSDNGAHLQDVPKKVKGPSAQTRKSPLASESNQNAAKALNQVKEQHAPTTVTIKDNAFKSHVWRYLYQTRDITTNNLKKDSRELKIDYKRTTKKDTNSNKAGPDKRVEDWSYHIIIEGTESAVTKAKTTIENFVTEKLETKKIYKTFNEAASLNSEFDLLVGYSEVMNDSPLVSIEIKNPKSNKVETYITGTEIDSFVEVVDNLEAYSKVLDFNKNQTSSKFEAVKKLVEENVQFVYPIRFHFNSTKRTITLYSSNSKDLNDAYQHLAPQL